MVGQGESALVVMVRGEERREEGRGWEREGYVTIP